MNEYIYETHLHTSEGSACGASKGEEYIEPYVKAGYDGIFVTDHFFGGNTAAPKDADWETRVNAYCLGYENALKAANHYNQINGTNFKVFFGIEQTFNGDDYLIYGLDKEWLLSHPEAETMRHKEWFESVKKVGGLMIQAHPFRMRDYINAIHLHPRDIHGIEIYNAGNKSEENVLAEMYAKTYNFPVTSGSDIHHYGAVVDEEKRKTLGGMVFETPLKDIFDYAERIKFNKGRIR